MKLRHVDNPPNPYESRSAEWLEPPPVARVEVYEETCKSILNRNDSPDLPFTWSLNPYRGCQHACAYCYARTTHEYLGYGAGTDFDTKLVVKVNAADLLRQVLVKPSWQGESIMFCGATDCYQPIEAGYEITRQCLTVCLEHANPVGVITKGFLIVRDVDLLAELHERAGVTVQVSIPFDDREACKLIEPQAPPPARRYEIIERLHRAGIPVGVMVSPIIPGLSDRDVPAILKQAAQAGAQWACHSALRLPGSVESVFISRLTEAMPLRVWRILGRLRDIRGGKLNNPQFGQRMRGTGRYWESVKQLFEINAKQAGLEGPPPPPAPARPAGLSGKKNSPQLQFHFDPRS